MAEIPNNNSYEDKIPKNFMDLPWWNEDHTEYDSYKNSTLDRGNEEQTPSERYEAIIKETKASLDDLKIECPNPIKPSVDMCKDWIVVSDPE